MSTPVMIAHLLLESVSRNLLPRVPETQMVMEAQEQVAAFAQSGRHEGILTYVCMFHAAMALPVIRPGDRVLDLGCGPANQLAQIARLNPHSDFIGLDASHSMLELARSTLATEQLGNVSLRHGYASRLEGFDTRSLDCVLCTMSLHHLPDIATLEQTMNEIRRVLKPGGGIYLADFARLKRAATQRYFAYDRASEQSEQFTQDFLNSMRAAFSLDELSRAIARLATPVQRYQTALAPFMTIFRSPPRRQADAQLTDMVSSAFQRLTPLQQRDFYNLARWFQPCGLTLPCALDQNRSRQDGRYRSETSAMK